MKNERRKHKRFSPTAFTNLPVHTTPLPPYFGHAIKGKLINLSAGGMAVAFKELILEGTILSIKLKFPDSHLVECVVLVRRVMPRGRQFLHGIEFLNIPTHMAEHIDNMSNDYIDCESRIQSKKADICKTNCAYYSMCRKSEKINPTFNVDTAMELTFSRVEDPTVKP